MAQKSGPEGMIELKWNGSEWFVAVRCLDGERYVEDFTVHPA